MSVALSTLIKKENILAEGLRLIQLSLTMLDLSSHLLDKHQVSKWHR